VKAAATRLFIAISGVLAFVGANAQQIHIKARFIQVPEQTLQALQRNAEATSDGTETLTPEQTQIMLRMLEAKPGVEELAEPEVTTLSGRQTEMRATQIITVITNFAYRETSTTTEVFPQTNAVETGPILDTIPTVLPDGYTIDLKTTASVTEFLGYDTPPTKPVEHINDSGGHVPVSLPVVLPTFHVRQTKANLNLWDGQTVVLGGFKNYFYESGKEVSAEPDYFVKTKIARGQPDEANEEVLVFITVTLVDPAGNRIHSKDEMPFAKDAIPPQDGL
jgi:Flp pilus assembly secretin CpaC